MATNGNADVKVNDGKIFAKIGWDLSSTNQNRYSKPWGAVVEFDEAGRYKGYDFQSNTFNGAWTDKACVTIIAGAQPAIVATGIKDTRGSNSFNEWYLVTAEEIIFVTRDEAYTLLVEAIAKHKNKSLKHEISETAMSQIRNMSDDDLKQQINKFHVIMEAMMQEQERRIEEGQS